MVTMTTAGGPVAGQLDLFGDAVPDVVPETVLMGAARGVLRPDLAGCQDA